MGALATAHSTPTPREGARPEPPRQTTSRLTPPHTGLALAEIIG